MKKRYLITTSFVLSLFVAPIYAQPTIVKVGSEIVDGTKLKPFSAQWDQFSTADGSKVKTASYQEQLELSHVDGAPQLKHTQTVKDKSGTQVTNITYFDRATLKPLRIQQNMLGVPEGSPDNRSFEFGDAQYKMSLTMPDGKQHNRTVHLPTDMFNVANLGLVFAAMPLALGETYRMPSTFPQYQDGLYWMDAKVTGETSFKNADGKEVGAWQVDIRWINIRGGDEYPAGPEASGGAYYISKQPGNGMPPVPAYVNDTIAIEVSFN